MHAMVFSCIECCFTNWSLKHETTFKQTESLYKRAIKILARKPILYCDFNILEMYNLLSFDNFRYSILNWIVIYIKYTIDWHHNY